MDEQDGMDASVAFAGDWDGHIGGARAAILRLAVVRPELRTVLHCGDFGLGSHVGSRYIDAVNAAAAEHDVRIRITPGDTDDLGAVRDALAATDEVQIASNISVLRRGARFTMNGVRFLSFGGASRHRLLTTTDPLRLIEFNDAPSVDDAARSAVDGHTDVLILHEAVNRGTRVPDHQIMLEARDRRLPDWMEHRADTSRSVVTALRQRTQPQVTVCAHRRVRSSRAHADGSRVYSLASWREPGNIGFLSLGSGQWQWLEEAAIRPVRGQVPGWTRPVSNSGSAPTGRGPS